MLPFAGALHACPVVEEVGDDALDSLWGAAVAAYGRAAKETAVRAILLAEGRGTLRAEQPDAPNGAPVCPVQAAARALPRGEGAPADALPLPPELVAHALRQLPAADVARAAATCRLFGRASRLPSAFGTLRTSAWTLARMARRGWWAFPARRPETLAVRGRAAPAWELLSRMWDGLHHVQLDEGLHDALPPQHAVRTLECWDVDQTELQRLVQRPDCLTSVHVRELCMRTPAEGRWWSAARVLEQAAFTRVCATVQGMHAFRGFPALRELSVCAATAGSPPAPVDVGVVHALLAACTAPLRRVHLRVQLAHARPLPALPHGVDRLLFTLPFNRGSLALLRACPAARRLTVGDSHGEVPLHDVFLAVVGRVTEDVWLPRLGAPASGGGRRPPAGAARGGDPHGARVRGDGVGDGEPRRLGPLPRPGAQCVAGAQGRSVSPCRRRGNPVAAVAVAHVVAGRGGRQRAPRHRVWRVEQAGGRSVGWEMASDPVTVGHVQPLARFDLADNMCSDSWRARGGPWRNVCVRSRTTSSR